LLVADELEDAELAAVADAALAESDDAGVAAGAILVARADVVEDVLDELGGAAELAVPVALDLIGRGDVEELLGEVGLAVDDGALVIGGPLVGVEPLEGGAIAAELGGDEAPSVDVSALGEGDDLLDQGLDGLGPGQGGGDLPVLEDARCQVAEGGAPVRIGPTQFVSRSIHDE
jgi:hypothetical protein